MGIKTKNRILCKVDNESAEKTWESSPIESDLGIYERLNNTGVLNFINPEMKIGDSSADSGSKEFNPEFKLIPKVQIDISELEKIMEGSGLKVVKVLEKN